MATNHNHHNKTSNSSMHRKKKAVHKKQSGITSIEEGRREYDRMKKIRERNQKSVLTRLNLGMVVFVGIFIYMVYSFFRVVREDTVARYQVVSGALSVDTIYKGIAIRTEEEFYADQAGYINYYASEGIKAGCGNLVYTLDATGELTGMLENQTEQKLTDEEFNHIRDEIVHFQNGYMERDFGKVYDFKSNLDVLLSRYRTNNIMESIVQLNQSSNGAQIRLMRAEKPGIVVYRHDGYEQLTKEKVRVSDLDETQYEPVDYVSNTLVTSGDPVYKMITEEEWTVAIQIDETLAKKLEEETYLQVRFLKTQDISWAKTEIKRTPDGILMFLTFNSGMITFCNERYVDVEILLEKEDGLKIPNSAITEKEFYLIPIQYVVRGGDSQKQGVLVIRYDENGKEYQDFKQLEMYYQTDAYYYVSDDDLEIGTVIALPAEIQNIPPAELDENTIRNQYEEPSQSALGVVSNEVGENEDFDYPDPNADIPGSMGSNVEGEEGKMLPVESSEIPESEEQQEEETTTSQESETMEGETVSETTENTTTENELSTDSNASLQNASLEPKLTVSQKAKLIGVYNMNKGYADFRQITILYQNDEYAIVKPNTTYGLCEYDYIVLNANRVSDNDLMK